jgi:hypothetical protein
MRTIRRKLSHHVIVSEIETDTGFGTLRHRAAYPITMQVSASTLIGVHDGAPYGTDTRAMHFVGGSHSEARRKLRGFVRGGMLNREQRRLIGARWRESFAKKAEAKGYPGRFIWLRALHTA